MNAPIIVIKKLNETWLRVECPEIYQELDIQDRFSFVVEGAQFTRKKHWNGVKQLYNRRTKQFPLGLLLELLSFFEESEFEYQLDPVLIPDSDTLDLEDIKHLVEDIICPKDKDGNDIEVTDFQYDAILYILNMGRSVCVSATSSGKSLIIYLALRIYELMDELRNKTLCVTVPSITLVNQMWSDFDQYSLGTGWSLDKHCQRMHGSTERTVTCKIVITTWQTQSKLPQAVLDKIGVIFFDECHLCKAATLTSICESLVSCEFKHGLTGTLDGCEVNELSIQGLLGPVKKIVSAKEIMDIGFASQVKVKMMLLNHNIVTRGEFDKFRKQYFKNLTKKHRNDAYLCELEFLNVLNKRKEFLFSFIDSLPGNTLILFDRVTSYGQVLFEEYHESHSENSFYITGKVDGDERESIRTGMESQDKSTLWASYGTLSTGVSINKLHNCVLISSAKSKIRVLQTIGRMMRLHSTKNEAIIYDIVDNLGNENFMMSHAQSRIEYYTNEEFDLEFEEINV